MMPVNIQFIIHYIILIIWIEKSCGTRTDFDLTSYENEFKGIKDNLNYADKIYYSHQSSSDSPVTFKAPVKQTKNFWKYNPRLSSWRKKFLDDSGYFNYEMNKSKIFPGSNGLTDFISPLHYNTSSQKLKKSKISFYQAISEPYKYEYPFELHITTEENFLPPPKPIRASIIKLETVTRSPHFYESLDHNDTPKNFQRFLDSHKNDTEKLNTLHMDELGIHSTSAIHFRTGPSLPFKHISKDKKFTQPKQSYNFNKQDLNDAATNKILIMAETHNISEENSTEKNIPNVFIGTENFSSKDNKEFPTIHNKDSEDNIAFLATESIKMNGKYNAALQSFIDDQKELKHINTRTLEKGTTETILGNCINDSDSIINVGRIRDNSARPGKIFEKLKPIMNDNSIKIVTDLTLAGLLKCKEQSANIPIYIKYLNMSSLIRYELNKLKNNKLPTSGMDKSEKIKDSSSTSANKISKIVGNDDDLSLDLKILKDTNWDGFTTRLPVIFPADDNTTAVILNIRESDTHIKKYPIEQRKINYERTPLEIFKPLTRSIRNNSSENGENISVKIKTRLSTSVKEATQFLHNNRSQKLVLNKNEKNGKQNFKKMEGLKFMDDFTKDVVLRINNKNERMMKHNNSKYLNDNSNLFLDVKTNKFLNSTIIRNFNMSKRSSQNNFKESNTFHNGKNRIRRGRKYRQKLNTKTQHKHENTLYNSSSINNSFANRKTSQRNVVALAINLNNKKNQSQKTGNYSTISEYKSSEKTTQYEGKKRLEHREQKSMKKLKRKRPTKRRRIIHSHFDESLK